MTITRFPEDWTTFATLRFCSPEDRGRTRTATVKFWLVWSSAMVAVAALLLLRRCFKRGGRGVGAARFVPVRQLCAATACATKFVRLSRCASVERWRRNVSVQRAVGSNWPRLTALCAFWPQQKRRRREPQTEQSTPTATPGTSQTGSDFQANRNIQLTKKLDAARPASYLPTLGPGPARQSAVARRARPSPPTRGPPSEGGARAETAPVAPITALPHAVADLTCRRQYMNVLA